MSDDEPATPKPPPPNDDRMKTESIRKRFDPDKEQRGGRPGHRHEEE